MEANDKNENIVQIKGIKFQILSFICAIIGILLLAFVGSNLYRIVENYKDVVKEFDLHLESHSHIAELQNGSDDMTEQSRLFVTTKNPECMTKYFDIVDNEVRENGKEKSEDYFSEMGFVKSVDQLDKALNESDALMEYELHSMKLITVSIKLDEKKIPKQIKNYKLPEDEEKWSIEKQQEYASELVFGDAYREKKAQIDTDIANAVEAISKELEKDTEDSINKMWHMIGYMIVSCIFMTILFAVVFVSIMVLVIRPLRDYVKCIKEGRQLSVIGAYEFKYLAQTYNSIFRINQENKARMNFELEHDALTNVYSRLAFEEQKKLLAQKNLPIALLVIDVDLFKNVNDMYGHDAGDMALKKTAEVMHRFVRKEDFVARIGGDEFAIIFMNVHAYNASMIIEKIDRINDILQNPEEGDPKITLSVGIAFSENGYSEELFKHADKALYCTKTTGKCGYSIYKED